ncbi:MAG: nucleotide exchange factor GrpE [Lentisphaeria bacterium]
MSRKNDKKQKHGKKGSDKEMKNNGEEIREEKSPDTAEETGTSGDLSDIGGVPSEQEEETETSEEKEQSPEERIRELENQLKEAQEKYLRAKAEFDNYKKRMQKEVGEVRTYAKANTIEQFLSVFDHFQMAMEHMGAEPDVQTMKQGMDMIYEELRNTFESLGVKRLEAEGQAFNPAEHEAMAEEHSDQVPAGQIIRQWKCGYRLGDRLIRPATVVVSKGPADENENKADGEEKENKEGNGDENK